MKDPTVRTRWRLRVMNFLAWNFLILLGVTCTVGVFMLLLLFLRTALSILHTILS